MSGWGTPESRIRRARQRPPERRGRRPTNSGSAGATRAQRPDRSRPSSAGHLEPHALLTSPIGPGGNRHVRAWAGPMPRRHRQTPLHPFPRSFSYNLVPIDLPTFHQVAFRGGRWDRKTDSVRGQAGPKPNGNGPNGFRPTATMDARATTTTSLLHTGEARPQGLQPHAAGTAWHTCLCVRLAALHRTHFTCLPYDV